jgi:peptidoglycan/xylan/chitin deacetylase (PgdA/CDA1 family)
MPILKKLDLPATFFISSGFLDLTKEEEKIFTKTKLFKKLPPREITGGLTSEDIRILAKEGFMIGGHTVNHIDLELTNNTEEIRNEIFEDKARLEKITGSKVDFFSYPCGAYANPDLNISQVLREAGYKGAVTVIPGFNNSGTSQYLLHRDIIEAGLPHHIFRARATGNHDAVAFIKRNIPFNFDIFS